MKKYKYLLEIIGKFFIYLLVYILFISLNLFSYKTSSLISFIYLIFLFFLSGFKFSKRSKYKGYISGSIIGGILSLIMFVISIILGLFSGKIFTYYLVLIISSVIGGMISSLKKAQ